MRLPLSGAHHVHRTGRSDSASTGKSMLSGHFGSVKSPPVPEHGRRCAFHRPNRPCALSQPGVRAPGDKSLVGWGRNARRVRENPQGAGRRSGRAREKLSGRRLNFAGSDRRVLPSGRSDRLSADACLCLRGWRAGIRARPRGGSIPGGHEEALIRWRWRLRPAARRRPAVIHPARRATTLPR